MLRDEKSQKKLNGGSNEQHKHNSNGTFNGRLF